MPTVQELYQQYLAQGGNVAGPNRDPQIISQMADQIQAGQGYMDSTGQFVLGQDPVLNPANYTGPGGSYVAPGSTPQIQAPSSPNQFQGAPDWLQPYATNQPQTTAGAMPSAPDQQADFMQYYGQRGVQLPTRDTSAYGNGVIQGAPSYPGNIPGTPGNLTGGIARELDLATGFYGPTQINPITLPGPPTINAPSAQAAQFNLGQVPQPAAQTPQSFPQLDFLLSGQGFGPDVMSKLRAGAIDDNARVAAAQRGSSRIAAEQSGLGLGPGQQAVEAQINRRAGDAQTQSLNQLGIENAMRGLENLRTGVGFESNRLQSGAQMANQMALENAARLFAGMQQNVANSQQMGMFNTGNQFTANQQNAANQINQGSNQAQLNRQGDLYNAGVYENRYGQASNAMANMINASNPAGYYGQAAQYGSQYTPNNALGNVISNAGLGFMNAYGNVPTTQS